MRSQTTATERPEHSLGRLWFSMKRDVKNALNPMTYLDPLLNLGGYSFNPLVIAVKESIEST